MTRKDDSVQVSQAVEKVSDIERFEIAIDESNQPRYDSKETKRLLRKVDWRVLPVLTFLYLVSFIDRGNIGNAKVAGMNTDLGLTDSQFNLALTVRLLSDVQGVLHVLMRGPRSFSFPTFSSKFLQTSS